MLQDRKQWPTQVKKFQTQFGRQNQIFYSWVENLKFVFYNQRFKLHPNFAIEIHICSPL